MAIRGANPVWDMVDLVGLQMDDTYYLWVLENDIPYIPSTSIWHDADETTIWSNPIQVLANGTMPINIFFDPEQLYRLEWRQNLGLLPPSQSDPLIYLVEDYSPGTGGGGNITTVSLNTDNQLTNAQFSLINFSSPLTLTGATNQTISVAPGWDLVLPGTGNATLTQVPLNSAAGNANPTNAPYALQVNISGWNEGEVYLRQRFEQSGMLWAGKYVSASVTAKWTSGNSRALTGKMYSSLGAELTTVLSTQDASTNFVELSDNGLMPATTNTQFPPSAYVEYRLYLPSTVNMQLTSLQLVVGSQPLTFGYEQDTIQRQVDHTFHYYKPYLEYKPIPSYLVGWDFPLNPAQLGSSGGPTTLGGANKSQYIWDQTILFASFDNYFSWSRASNGALVLTNAGAAINSGAIIQYLDATQAREILSQPNALQLMASSNSAGGLTAYVSIYWTTGAVPTLPLSVLGSVSGTGLPTPSAGWTVVTNTNQNNNYKIPLTSTSTVFNLNGFDASATAASTTATAVAIVVSFSDVGIGSTVTFDYCSLNLGNIATRPAPQTPDEVLRECQYYYQKSFLAGTAPVQNAGVNTGESYFLSIENNPNANYFPIRFSVPMRTTPTAPTLYNPAAANAEIRNISANADYSATSVSTVGGNNTLTAHGFVITGTSNGVSVGNLIGVHWSADARLGII